MIVIVILIILIIVTTIIIIINNNNCCLVLSWPPQGTVTDTPVLAVHFVSMPMLSNLVY